MCFTPLSPAECCYPEYVLSFKFLYYSVHSFNLHTLPIISFIFSPISLNILFILLTRIESIRYERLRINFAHLKQLGNSELAVEEGLKDPYVSVRTPSV